MTIGETTAGTGRHINKQTDKCTIDVSTYIYSYMNYTVECIRKSTHTQKYLQESKCIPRNGLLWKGE